MRIWPRLYSGNKIRIRRRIAIMKMRRSVLLVAVCLLVVMSISVVAFAATSQVFRRGVLDGYDYVCKGDISGLVATATFTATAN